MTLSTNQETTLVKSLRITTRMLKECAADYRIIGSVLIAAHTKKIFRRIGDLDLIISSTDKARFFKKLKREGYSIRQRSWGFFSWYEADKEGYLGLSILLIGDFRPTYFSYRFLKFCELRITNPYLRPTNYQFGGVSFIGIPLSSVIAGIKQAFLNPKRQIDNEVLRKHKLYSKASARNQINVFIFGLKIPYLYGAFSFLYNIYGGIRVVIGKKYESW